MADALSTAFACMPPEDVEKVLHSYPSTTA
jgi:thiamine biosynthesis lipoprotein ApbE